MSNLLHIESDKSLVAMGKKRSGKSTALRWYAFQFKRVIVYDPLNTYPWDELPAFNPGKESRMLRFLKKHKEKPFRIRYKAYWDNNVEFERCNAIVFRQRNLIYLVEELATHCTMHTVPPWLDKISREGGNYNIGFWFTTQEPKMIPRRVRTQVSYGLLFYEDEPDLVAYMQKWFGDAYQPESLGAYEYYWYDDSKRGEEKLTHMEPVKNTKIKKVIRSRI